MVGPLGFGAKGGSEDGCVEPTTWVWVEGAVKVEADPTENTCAAEEVVTGKGASLGIDSGSATAFVDGTLEASDLLSIGFGPRGFHSFFLVCASFFHLNS